VGDPAAVAGLDPVAVRHHLAAMRQAVQDAVDRSRTAGGDLDLVAVGGGAFLVPDRLDGISQVHRVEHAGVANAVGAAMAQVSGDVDQVFTGTERTAAIDAALALAVQRAEAAGADAASIEVVEVEDLPLAYVPGGARRVRARVVGDVAR
ncbi:hydantoinase, partial [cyanobacterium TDX16]